MALLFQSTNRHSFLDNPCSLCHNINSLPHDKILDWFKLKAFADDKIKVTEKLKFVLGRVENTVRKGQQEPSETGYAPRTSACHTI